MKKLSAFSLFFILSSFFLCIPFPAFAHFFETDGTITGEFHIEPSHSPTPGEKNVLYFGFVDTLQKFSVEKCICTLSIFEDPPIGEASKKEIFHTLLVPRKDISPSIYDATLSYTFPDKALYTLVLIATPKTASAFQPFTLTWDFRVTQNPKPKPIDFTKTMLTYFGVIFGAFFTIAFVSFGVILVGKLLNKKKKSSN